MPSLIINETYNQSPYLKANAGDWVRSSVEISTRFSLGSGNSNKITYTSQGGIYSLNFQSGNWADAGFVVGDTIVLTYTFYSVSAGSQNQTFTSTITYINGTSMQIADPLTYTNNSSVYNHASGVQFPTTSYTSGVLVVSSRTPDNIDFLFNLAPNGTPVLNSVIDSELTRFESPNLSTLGIGSSMAMTPMAKKSGSYIKNVIITPTASASSPTYWRRYKVSFDFWQWGVIQNGYTTDNPTYYDNNECLAPVLRLKVFPMYGNPNGILQVTNETLEANTGGWNENYNGGLSEYSVIDTNFKDHLGDTISAVDYSNPCTFEAIINAPNQSSTQSTYKIGMLWRPIDGTLYQNKVATDLGQNLLVLSPNIDFTANGVVDTTVYDSEIHPSGAMWSFTDLKFELTGANELTVSGKIIPNLQAFNLFESIPDGGRKTTLFVSIGDHTLDGTNTSKRVSLKLFDNDNYNAPTKGVQIPTVEDQFLYDHNGNDITTPEPQTTTEDDVLYTSRFTLEKYLNYEGVRARIYAYNTVSEEEFNLEDIFFNFSNVVNVNGVFEANFDVQRGFNLPLATDRNHVSLKRDQSLDSGNY